MKKLYFGHPLNVYGTDLEKFLLDMITEMFRDYEIVNPGLPIHGANYVRWKKETGNGMDYFFKEVLPACRTGVFMPFRDGKWGAGVFGEAKFISERGFSIYSIAPLCPDSSVWKIEHIIIKEMSPHALSVEETRARVYAPDGKTVIPY